MLVKHRYYIVLSPPSCSRRAGDSGATIDYSKPPAGATWTTAGGFALASVPQEWERQSATYASEALGHSCARTYL